MFWNYCIFSHSITTAQDTSDVLRVRVQYATEIVRMTTASCETLIDACIRTIVHTTYHAVFAFKRQIFMMYLDATNCKHCRYGSTVQYTVYTLLVRYIIYVTYATVIEGLKSTSIE